MLNSNPLFGIIIILGASVLAPNSYAEELYQPPKMFQQASEKTRPTLKTIKNRPNIIKPLKKPAYNKKTPRKLPSKTITVSTTARQAKSVVAPEVNTQSLMPQEQSKKPLKRYQKSQVIDTSIAFLPSSIDLTSRQKVIFEKAIKTYFIERNAKQITVTIYATPTNKAYPDGAKRKAFARGLSIREWLKGLGVPTKSIEINAIGETSDDQLPNRADIKITL
jgi:hypothetical protein